MKGNLMHIERVVLERTRSLRKDKGTKSYTLSVHLFPELPQFSLNDSENKFPNTQEPTAAI